jgi:lactoylglutathione lyase
MRYLHTMIRVLNLDDALRFWRDQLGLQVLRRADYPQGRFSLLFLGTGAAGDAAQLELTWNWDQEQPYTEGRNFGHVAFAVDDIYATCARLQAGGVAILRPPRDGRMAFIRSPDGISVELLQAGDALPPAAPWADLPNQGTW